MFGTLLDAGVTGVCADHVLLAVQQLIDLGDIRDIGCRDHHAVHQTRFIVDTYVCLGPEVILVALLGLMHLWVAFAVLVLGRARCIDQCGIDNGALAQRQATVTQVAIDHGQDASSQFVFLQQATEVEDGGFVGDTLQAQPRELPQDGGLVQCLFHRRIAVAKPVLHQMNPQHRHQRIGRTSAFTLGVVGLDQGNQTLPWHYPIHFDQEQLFAGLLALAGVLGVGESHLLHRATRRVGSGYFAKSGSLLQSFLSHLSYEA